MKIFRCGILLLSLFLTILKADLYSQTYYFQNFNTEEGLPQSYIYQLLQDNDGYLWVCTGEGLSKYDGKDFQNYTTANGLAENFVTTAFKDRKGNIWLGHFQGGITVFNGNTFTKKEIPGLNAPVNTIVQDASGNIWIATQSQGLIRIAESGKYIHYKEPFSNYIIHTIAFDREGNFLAGTSDGLIHVRVNGSTLTPARIEGETGDVSALWYRKDKDTYWVGTKENGIFEFKNKTLHQVRLRAESMPDNINILYEDSQDNLFVSSSGKGIFKFDIKDNTGTLIQTSHYHKQTGLSGDYVRSIFIDRENNLWIGTYGNGLDILVDPLFTLYSTQEGLSGQNVAAVLEDSLDNIWAGTERGVTKIHFNGPGLRTETVKLPLPDEEQDIKAMCMLPDKDVLIAVNAMGIYKVDHKSGKASVWFYNEADPLSNKVNSILSDRQGNIWIATNGGVYRKDKGKDVFEQFTIADGLAHNHVHTIFEDSKGYLWFATHETGISRYYKGKFEILDLQGMEIFNINCFAEDKKGRLLIGTYGDGIHVLEGEKFLNHLTKESGLGSNYCYTISLDKNGNFWVGHKEGISKVQADFKKCYFYRRQEGFQGESVNLNAQTSDHAGNLWFGTRAGLLKYNLNADKPTQALPITHITSVDIFYKKQDWTDQDSIAGPYGLPSNLKLNHNRNHLTFNFVGISLRPGQKLNYQYMLEGFEGKWSLITHETFVTYSNLPDGVFTFKVRAQNKDGVWGPAAAFSFEVLKPFWKTWWFVLLSTFAAIASVVLIVRLRTIQLAAREADLKKQNDRLLAEINERKLAERMRMESEKKLNQINKELSTFIYSSSHDLKGPLASIIGLTNLAKKEITESNALNYFNKISECTYKLDNILKGLREATTFKDWKVQCSIINFDRVITKIRNSYDQEKEQIQFNCRIDVKNEFLSDAHLIRTIIQYIVDNSVKYRKLDPETDYINIEIADHKKGVLIRISDNGVGINKNLQGKVFDMFFKASLRSKGAGLGLYLVKNSVEKLEGEVNLLSEEEVGTVVEVYLPSLVPQLKYQFQN